MTKTIVDIQVVDAEKRRVPSKHYVYVIVVKWSDNSSMVVYRRYSRFFDLQTQLLDKFPIEAGSTDPSLRLIPFLPGKIFFGRSQVRDVAMKRLGEIDAYCKSLLALPEHISQCDEVLAFFEVEPDDLDPPKEEPSKNKAEKKAEKISGPKQLEQYVAVADYETQDKGEMTLTAGMLVEVTEKSESGWWFVNAEEQQGWVPSTYLEPADGTATSHAASVRDGQEEKYICIETFSAQNEDEVSLEKGVIVEVKQKSMDGWWKVKYQGREGFAPATYLKKSNDPYAKSLVEKSRQSGVKIIGNLADVSNLLAGSASPRNSGIFSGSSPQDSAGESDSARVSRASVMSREEDEGEEWDEEEENDVLNKLDSKMDARPASLAKVMMKQRSLERGGSLKPPPRQNSIQKMVVHPTPPPTPAKSSTYVTIADFEDTVGDGISFSAGEAVTVLEKSASGWWFVERGQDQGWVPESFLEESSDSQTQNSTGHGVEGVQEDSDEGSDDSEDDNHTGPPSATLASVLNSRLKGGGDSKNSVRPSAPAPPKPHGKAAGKPPSLPLKPKEQNAGDVDAPQSKEPATGLTGALKAKFESKPSGQVNKPGDKPSPPSLPNKSGDKPSPPGLSNKSGDKPSPPGLPGKPAPSGLPNKPAGKTAPTKPEEKPTPPWLAVKPTEKPPGRQFDKPAPPGLPSKPSQKPSVPDAAKKLEKPEEDGVSGSVSGIASALRSRFESQGQEDRPAKPSFQPKPAKSFGDSQNKPCLPGKPAFGAKPSPWQKPTLSAKSDTRPLSAVKPQLPPSKTPSGPPKLPSKPQVGSKPCADSNNNSSNSADRPVSSRVHNMAAALGKMGVGQNSAENGGAAKPSLPGKKPTPHSLRPETRRVCRRKTRVGNLVSELGNKLNFGGGALLEGREKSGTFPVSKTGPWSAHSEKPQQPAPVKSPWSAKAHSEKTQEPAPVKKTAPWSSLQPASPPQASEGGAEFEAIADFAAEGSGELALRCGDVVEVLDRQQAEWWLVTLDGEEGWVPSSYLEPAAQWDD